MLSQKQNHSENAKSESVDEKQSTQSFVQREKKFLFLMGVFFIIAGSTYQLPEAARWVGFILAGYAAIANDSIQTIGTFIASNKHRPWWALWLFIGGIFVATMWHSWMNYGGPVDVHIENIAHDTSSSQAVLRISLEEEGTQKHEYREMHLDLEEGGAIRRESLGMDVSIARKVTGVELGVLGAQTCFLDGQWRAKPADIDKDTKKKVCWNGSTLPKGATEPPAFVQTYAEGIAASGDASGQWNVFQQGEPRGFVRIDTRRGGDVSSQRLFAKGFDLTPQKFSFLQLAAPIFLLILTRLKMPVSTTFLLLTSFATEAKSIGNVLGKSFTGYFLAFGIAMAVWLTLSPLFKKWFQGTPHALWTGAQWATTGLLWSIWLMQDAANIAVFLPRQLSPWEFVAFALPVFLGLGIMFRMGGDRIQQIVDEKSQIVDVRSATIIDLIYAVILFYFKMHSKIPMSTTWVFLGLIGGREIAMNLRHVGDRSVRGAVFMMLRDTGAALLGLFISFLIAMACNQAMYDGVMTSLGVL